MNDRQRKLMFELFTGTIISQEIIVHVLHRHGLIGKQEVIDRLDFFIDYFERKGSEQIAVPMRYLRKNLGKQFPDVARPAPARSTERPAWFQGVIPGGRGENTKSSPSTAAAPEPH